MRAPYCIGALTQLKVSLTNALSAGTILLLFWTIARMIQKVMPNNNLIANLGATIGSLIYTFSDSFWFSAVEGEVYAMSSFFTALVFWSILKWEQEFNINPKANKWLIFIGY